jgi:hypothetical protein
MASYIVVDSTRHVEQKVRNASKFNSENPKRRRHVLEVGVGGDNIKVVL